MAPLLEALQVNLDEAWQVETVEIFPWVPVIGVRDLLDSAAIKRCLEFLELPRRCWRRNLWQIIEETVKESVKAVIVLHCLRCKALQIVQSGRMPTTQNRVLDKSSGVFDADDPLTRAGGACNQKRRPRLDGDLDDTRRGWKQVEKMTQKAGLIACWRE